jgi:hypothetical protein
MFRHNRHTERLYLFSCLPIISSVILGAGRPAHGSSRWWAARASLRTTLDDNSYLLIHSHSPPTVKKNSPHEAQLHALAASMTTLCSAPVPPQRPHSPPRLPLHRPSAPLADISTTRKHISPSSSLSPTPLACRGLLERVDPLRPSPLDLPRPSPPERRAPHHW